MQEIVETRGVSKDALTTISAAEQVLSDRSEGHPYAGYNVTPSQSTSVNYDGSGGNDQQGSWTTWDGQTVVNTPTLEDAMRSQRQVPDPNCFPKGTPIQTPFGEVAIENVKVGDKVLAFDPVAENGLSRLVAKEVTRLFSNTTTEFLKLTWAEDGETKEVVTTPGHHFLCEGGGFAEIGDMTKNGQARIVLMSGEAVTCQVERIIYSAETAELFDRAKSCGVVGSGALALQMTEEWETFNFEVAD